MKKTIKKNVHMRLDELIKYVRENKKTLFKGNMTISFKTKNNNEAIFYYHGQLTMDNWNSSVDLFEVEVEEEITEDTKFDLLLELWLDDGEYRTYSYINRCIGQLKDSNTVSIYAIINGKLELIWERDNQ